MNKRFYILSLIWILSYPGFGFAQVITATDLSTPGVELWRGNVAGNTITILEKELTIHPVDRPDSVLFSLAGRQGYRLESNPDIFIEDNFDSADLEMNREIYEERGIPEEYNHEYVEVVSIVGPIVSYKFQSNYYSFGAAHPSGRTWYRNLDVTRDNDPASLLDYFDRADIFSALKNDSVVQRICQAQGREADEFQSLDELLEFLKWHPDEESCAYFDGMESLKWFAFHHLDGDRVAVRLGLPAGYEFCRDKMPQIGLLLPIPDQLHAALNQADQGTEGFLVHNRPTALRGKPLAFEWTFSWEAYFKQHPKVGK